MASLHTGKVEEETLVDFDESLLSLEKLDRASPELWPEQIPGVSEFVSLHDPAPREAVQPWAQRLDSEDINLIHQFGSLTAAGLIDEVKKLHNFAYQLGLEEAKEMTRGKYLNILTKRRR
ncbi:protein lin-52 homolog isoform X2 [Ischnura elegans]|uniref:protein lin-52 homolog isoform X2 n=1 Tax=Ischnura elegans TaxID=197161 RepID=UPI001ED8745B|nr:protein lin-52 homolog isoform X2 [Ischnura elegans]